MITKDIVKKEALNLNIEFCGIAKEDDKTLIVCLFPYYVNYGKGNLSRYAAIPDYHNVAKKYLNILAKNCKFTDYKVYSDVSPYNERLLAYNAGLGVIGNNNLLINEKYGSYVFIGLIELTGVNLEPDSPLKKRCNECNRCIDFCVGKALKTNGFIKENCLSNITQKKRPLTDSEKNLIKKSGIVWGCDVCSEVCPMNEGVSETPFAEFRQNIVPEVFEKDIENLTNKQFLDKYKDRAFTWRGKNVLLRNCKILNEN